MLLEGSGSLLGLYDLFKRVSDILKNVKETREVEAQLKNVLWPLELYTDSSKASENSGKALAGWVDRIHPPISVQDAEDWMRLAGKFCNDFSGVLSSIVMFGKECNRLISGDFEGFMQKLRRLKPVAYDFVNFFGRNYDRKMELLDFTNLPMLIRLYGPKRGWRESHELSTTVKEGRETVSIAIKKARAIGKQRPVRVTNRRLIKDYFRSLQRLGREAKTLTSHGITEKELSGNAPSWFVELIGVVDDVQKTVPSGSRPGFRSHQASTL